MVYLEKTAAGPSRVKAPALGKDGYELSIRQVEFARTQILDRPLTGRILFEQIIRENLDLGGSDKVQFILVSTAIPPSDMAAGATPSSAPPVPTALSSVRA